MPTTARFHVDPRLATLLGEAYRSSEHALMELVDNAWDADAEEVRITLPEPMSGGPIIIGDDGTGMTPREVEQEYLVIANDRRSRKGEFTFGKRRPVKGRKGIGKFAGLMAADTMAIETRSRGSSTGIRIRREELKPTAGDLEHIDLPLETASCDREAHGTTITLTGLNQAFDAPTAERLKPLLILEYGRQDDFVIVVNGVALGIDDIPGLTHSIQDQLGGAGSVDLTFTISEGRRPLRQSGIAIRVAGKVIGKPLYFGLEEDDEIPRKLLKRVYGELIADGLVNDVTADWGAIVENSTAFATIGGWAYTHLKTALASVFTKEVQLARARRVQEINRRLEKMPEHRRVFAEAKIERVLEKFYEEREDRIDTVVSVTLDAIEYDEYYVAVEAIDRARAEDVTTFAAALKDFGLVDMANMADQARRRLAVLDQLDALLLNAATREADIHIALEHNLWVLGTEYALMASNKTLKGVVEQYGHGKFTGERAANRPDLLLLSGITGRHTLIEFKRPAQVITREHESQATEYRDELRTRFDPLEVTLIGWPRSSLRSKLCASGTQGSVVRCSRKLSSDRIGLAHRPAHFG